MAGPWERYAPQVAPVQTESGPWAAFAPAPAVPVATPEPQPSVSMPEAVGRGAAQGATFQFYDELRGLIEAGGANPRDPASLGKLLQGAFKYWSGDKEAGVTYDATKAREAALTKQAETERPYSSLAGNVVGAVAAPIGAVAGAATLPARIGRGSAVGAVTGALAGAGEGDGLADRAVRGATGAVIGGTVGAALPVGVEGVVRGARAVAQPVANAIRGVRNPESEGARRVALALQRDIALDPSAANRLTPQEFAAGKAAGEPLNLMDIGGELTRSVARSAANTSPEGRAALNKSINDRFEAQTPRVTSWLEKNYNYPDADLLKEAVREAGKRTNNPVYQRVMAQNPVVSVPVEITERPVIAQAMKDAVSLAKNHGEKLEGDTFVKTILSGPGYHIADDVASPGKTSLRYWDYVKKAIDSRIEGAQRRGGIEDLNSREKADFRGLVDAKNALVSHLDNVAKGYKEARAGAAAYFNAEDALDAGRKIVSSKMNNGEIARGLSKMTPGERKLAQDGFVSDFVAMLKETGDRRNVLNKIADSPAAKQRLDLVLGPQKAKEFEAMLRVEEIMEFARPAIQGNSTTARQLAELGLAGGTYGFSGGAANPLDPSAITNAVLVYGAAKGRNKINESVSRKVAEMLASNDPTVLLRGIKIVANNQQLFNSLRSADKGLARIGGQQSTGFAPMQAAGIGRAEEEQQPVPGPPR